MEVLESIAGDGDNLDHQSEHDEQDRHSEHSEHEHNPAEQEEGSKWYKYWKSHEDKLAGIVPQTSEIWARATDVAMINRRSG